MCCIGGRVSCFGGGVKCVILFNVGRVIWIDLKVSSQQ